MGQRAHADHDGGFAAEICRTEPALQSALLATKPALLVDTNMYDTVWGIGLHMADKCCAEHTKWCGQNLLGYMLTDMHDNFDFGK